MDIFEKNDGSFGTKTLVGLVSKQKVSEAKPFLKTLFKGSFLITQRALSVKDIAMKARKEEEQARKGQILYIDLAK